MGAQEEEEEEESPRRDSLEDIFGLDEVLEYCGPEVWLPCLVVAKFMRSAIARIAKDPQAERLVHLLGASSLAAVVRAMAKMRGLSDATTTLVSTVHLKSVGAAELRIPHAAWSPWLSLLLQGMSSFKRGRRNVFPIPPVCAVVAQDVEALTRIADDLDQRGEVGIMATTGFPRCTVYYIPRRRAIALLGRMPKPPDPKHLPSDGVLWAIVVPDDETSQAIDDGLSNLLSWRQDPLCVRHLLPIPVTES